jgi:hypothetical protein
MMEGVTDNDGQVSVSQGETISIGLLHTVKIMQLYRFTVQYL